MARQIHGHEREGITSIFLRRAIMKIENTVSVITGAGSGICRELAQKLAQHGAKALALVDRDDRIEQVASDIEKHANNGVRAVAYVGDVIDEDFRKRVYDEISDAHGIPHICVPGAGVTRDSLAVKIDKESGQPIIYPLQTFREVTEIDMVAPIYWALELVARHAADRRARDLKRWEPSEGIQGNIVFLGSVSSQGNKGQIAYAACKAGLEGAAATIMKEAIFHGVRCGVIHPGFTDTPMVRKLGEEYINNYVLPYTQLRRLIRPEEIADAICFMITNSAVSGELWCDAGWHPSA
jgi:NAD(P)-dependent dehydrogenase (short-subunit alcohol dehydrogenase family)